MSQSAALRVNPYTEIITGLQWGTGAGVILAACFGMAQDMLGSYGMTIVCHSYTGMIVGIFFSLLLALTLVELRLLHSFVVAISCALVFAMVQHQFANDPLIIASIIIALVLTYCISFSVERHWY